MAGRILVLLGGLALAVAIVLSDPATFSEPWTAALSLKTSDQPDVFEYACHEGNYAMRNILSGAPRSGEGIDGVRPHHRFSHVKICDGV